MAYSAQSDLEQAVGGASRLLPLADWDSDDVIDDGVVDKAIAEADALIDSYAQHRYSVPFSPVPVRIQHLSARLAIYNLQMSRGINPTLQEVEAHKEDIAWLEGLRDGRNSPGSDPRPPASSHVRGKNISRPSAKGASRAGFKFYA